MLLKVCCNSDMFNFRNNFEKLSYTNGPIKHHILFFPCRQESEYEEYVALADYQPMDSNEIPLSEGDIVELRKIGSDGWWFVRHVVTGEEGWAPASYLESVKRRSSHSTLSMSSLGKVLTACVFLTLGVRTPTVYPLHLVMDNGYSPATPVQGEFCLLGSCLY